MSHAPRRRFAGRLAFLALGVVLLAALGLSLHSPRQTFAAGIAVTSNLDNTVAANGLCTLREAIQNANSNSDTTGGDCTAGTGQDLISFAIASGPQSITLASALPTLTGPTTINGASQPGYSGTPIINIVASSVSGTVFTIQSANVTLSDLIFSGASGTALRLTNADNAVLERVNLAWGGAGQSGTGLLIDSGSDNLTLRGIVATRRREGVSITGGQDVRLLDSDLSGSGADTNDWALDISGVTAGTLPGGLQIAGNRFSNATTGVRLQNMAGLAIADSAFAGVSVDLTASGDHTLNTVTSYPLWLHNIDTSTVANLDLSWAAATSRLGTGLRINDQSDALTVTNIKANSRLTGIYANRGSDLRVLNSDLSRSGQDTSNWTLFLDQVGAVSLPGGIQIADNTFSNSYGVRINNMPNLVISDGSVAGTNIDLTDASGAHTLNTATGYGLYLNNADNLLVQNVDLGFSQTALGRVGTGLYIENGSDGVTVRDSSFRSRARGLSVNSGKDVRVINNDLGLSGSDANSWALQLNGIGKNTITDGVEVSGNSFTNAPYGVWVNNIPNLTISDGSVAGTDLNLTDGAGNHTLTTVSSYALRVTSADNLTIAGLDLSWGGSVAGSRSGNGLVLDSGNDNVTIRDNLIRNRHQGLSVAGGSDVRVLNNNLNGSGGDWVSTALVLNNIGKSALADGVEVAGNSFTGAASGVRISNIPNLTISDGSVAGTDINLTDGAGNHTLTTVSDYALRIINADNLTVAGLDLSWGGSVNGSRSGTGLVLESGNDNVTIRDNFVRNRGVGINISGGSDVRVLGNDLTNSGTDYGNPALNLTAIGKNTITDGVQVAGNIFTNAYAGLRINSMPNLTISDGSVAGTDIDLTNGAGQQTLGNATYPLYFINADNLTVAGLDLSWGGSVNGSRSGTGIYFESGNDKVTIRDNLVRNRVVGISVNGGSDVRVLNNDLSNSGYDVNNPALYLVAVGKSTITDGVEVAGNTFTNSGMGLRVISMPNLTISDGSVAGTDINLTDGAGNHTLTTASNGLSFYDADNLTVAKLDLSWANSLAGSRAGTGIVLETSSDNATIRDNMIRNRSVGVSATSNTDVRVLANDFANSGTHYDAPALYLNNITAGALPGGVLVADNDFSNGAAGITLLNLSNQVISDGSVAGTTIDVTNAAGEHTLRTVSDYPLSFRHNVDNSTISKLDLSWAHRALVGRSGYGIWTSTHGGNSNNNLVFSDLVVTGRSDGAYLFYAPAATVSCSVFADNNDGVESGYMASETNLTLSNNLLQGNATAVRWNVASPALVAQNNYWGAANGPSNLGGSGNGYVNGVSASPFLGSAPGCTTLPAVTPPVIVSDPATSFVVTTNSDVSDGTTSSIAALVASPGADGAISLREAIIAANNTAGADTIGFAIGSGPQTIVLGAVLPTITGQLTIDGSAQPITIDAQGLSGTVLTLQASDSKLRDFAISNAAGTALRVTVADNIDLRNLDLSWGSVGARRGTGLSVDSAADNLVIENITANRRSDGINVSGGSGLQIHNSTLHDNTAALALGSVSTTGLSIGANSYSFSGDGIRLTNMSGPVISDGSVAGTHIDLRDAGGAQTLVNVSGAPLTFNNVDDAVVRNLQLGWGGPTSGRSGTGLSATNGSDRLLVQGVTTTRRSTGVSISGGADQRVLDNTLGNTDQALYLQNLTSTALPGGVLVERNDYSDSANGVRLIGLRNLVISDGSVAGTNVDVRNAGGAQTLTSASTYPLWLSNVDDSSVSNLNLGWSGPTNGRSGYGLYADTASDRLLVQSNTAARRSTGVSISGGADQRVLDNTLGNTDQALYLQNLTSTALPGGVLVERNDYTNSANGIRFNNLRNLVISDGSVAGTNVDVRNAGGAQTLTSASTYPLWLSNVDDSSVRNLNLGWAGVGSGRSGTGLYADTGSDRLLVQSNTATRRGTGVSISGGADQRVFDNTLGNNSQALNLESITATTLPGGVLVERNDYSDSYEGIRLYNMRNLVISDGSVAGTNVDVRNAGGAQTLTTVTYRALWLQAVDDSSVRNLSLSWGGIGSVTGFGLYADAGSDRLQVRAIEANRRGYGVYFQNGVDVQVRDSDLRNNIYNLWLQDVTPGALAGGVAIAGNDYTNTESIVNNRAITLYSMRNLVVSDGSVAGTNIDLRNGSGAQTIGNAYIGIYLYNVDSSAIDSVDAAWDGPTPSGYGIYSDGANDNTVIRNSDFRNRSVGVYSNSGVNVDFINNNLSNSSSGLSLTSISNADISGNDFTRTTQPIRLNDFTGLTLGSNLGLNTTSGIAVELINVRNSTLNGLDLSYNGQIRQGTGLYIWGHSSTNIAIQNSRFVNRSTGILFANNGSNFAISCGYFVNNNTAIQAGNVNSNEGPTGLAVSSSRFQLNGVAVSNPVRYNSTTGQWNVPAPVATVENNFWGAASGPLPLGGAGDTYQGNVDADPFSPSSAACVNTPPTVRPGGPYAVDEGGSLGLNAMATSDVDQPTSSLSFRWDLDSDTLFGESGAGATRGEENGAATVFSAAGLDGADTRNVEIAVTDDSSTPVTQIVPILILNVAPAFDAGPDGTAFDGAFSRSDIAFTDPGSPDVHTVSVDWGDGNSDTFTLTVGERSFDLSHSYATAGTFTVQVTVSDDDGGQQSDSFNVVSSFNEPPTVSAIADTSTDEDTPTGAINFTVQDTHTAASDLTVTLSSSDQTLVPNVGLALGGGGENRSVTITPAHNLSGTATITVTVTDGVFTTTESFLLAVEPVNDAPTLASLSDLSVEEDAAAQQVSLSGIADGDPDEVQALTVSAYSSDPALIPNPTVDYTSPGATGTLSFTPALNATGSVTITVRVTDSGSGDAPDVNVFERSFAVTVNAVNDAPALDAIGDQSVAEDAPEQTVSLSGIADGDPELAQTLTITATSSDPSLVPHPAVSYSSPGASGELRFTPASDASGVTTITVRVSDDGSTGGQQVNSFERSFTVTVTAVNDDPSDVSLSVATVAENLPAETAVGALSATDVDGGPSYSYSLVSGAGDTSNDKFTLSGATLRTAAVFDYETQASHFIRVRVEDGKGGAFEKALVISVGDEDVAPTITSAAPTGGVYGTAYTHTFTASGEPESTFAVIGGALPPGLTLASDGTLSGAPTEAGTFGPIVVAASNGASPDDTQSFSLTIARAPLTVTAEDKSKVYGSVNPALSYTTSGLVNGDTTATALTGALATTADASSAVGGYPITQGTLAAANYAISFTGAQLTVTPASLTVTADDQSKVYGSANPALSYTTSGLVNGDTTATALTGALATTADVSSAVGSYPITQGSLAAANYAISFTAGELEVTPAPLTVTADDKARAYGAANPALSYTTSGLVNGDTAATALTGVLATTADVSSAVGSYPITQGSLAAANYAISFTNGTLTVSDAVLTVVADPQSKVYGTANPALSYQVSGFAAGDDASVLTGALTTAADSSSDAGDYAITQGTLAAANYAISFTGAQLTVTSAPLTVTADDQSKVYGAANPALSYTTSGLVNGDTAATALTGELATADASSAVGSYPITQGSLAAANYSISFTGAQLTVTPAPLTVTAEDKSKVYGSVNPALSYTTSGLVNGDTAATALTGELATADASSAVGGYPITQGTLAAANYSISFTAGELEVEKATLTVTADDQQMVEGEALPALTVRYQGFVLGETAAVLDVAPTGATTATGASPAGTYAITVAGGSDANYHFVYVGGTLTVTPAAPVRYVYFLPMVGK